MLKQLCLKVHDPNNNPNSTYVNITQLFLMVFEFFARVAEQKIQKNKKDQVQLCGYLVMENSMYIQ